MTKVRDRVSRHEALVFLVLDANRHTWLSNHEIAGQITGVARRTVRGHVDAFLQRGLVERADVFPGPRYRLVPDAEVKHAEYIGRLRETAEMFEQTSGT